jgi:hypothetical protein
MQRFVMLLVCAVQQTHYVRAAVLWGNQMATCCTWQSKRLLAYSVALAAVLIRQMTSGTSPGHVHCLLWQHGCSLTVPSWEPHMPGCTMLSATGPLIQALQMSSQPYPAPKGVLLASRFRLLLLLGYTTVVIR